MDGSPLETSKSSNISNKDSWFLNGPNQKRVYGVVCTSYAQKKWSTKKTKSIWQHVCGFKRWCFNVCKRNNPPLCTCLNGFFLQLLGGYPAPKPSRALTRSMFALLIIAMCRTWNHQKSGKLKHSRWVYGMYSAAWTMLNFGSQQINVNNPCSMKWSLASFSICYSFLVGDIFIFHKLVIDTQFMIIMSADAGFSPWTIGLSWWLAEVIDGHHFGETTSIPWGSKHRLKRLESYMVIWYTCQRRKEPVEIHLKSQHVSTKLERNHYPPIN